ncbi:MAG: cyclic pyranopterin monophosphate synthase MoaC [Opitutaceae bacterium]|nr:cyclic pyranopterin monophosphate synthase MoaC [Opitutaceae bacterium]
MLSHLDAKGRLTMVGVGDKEVTRRFARARAVVVMPPALAGQLKEGDIMSRKGSVFQAAVLAGIMGAKRTSDLIPLCHPLPLDDCKVAIECSPALPDGSVEAVIECRVETHGRTGVEMEALTGASIAALTLYDMGKAATHAIVIKEVRLLEKTGGKSDYATN